MLFFSPSPPLRLSYLLVRFTTAEAGSIFFVEFSARRVFSLTSFNGVQNTLGEIFLGNIGVYVRADTDGFYSTDFTHF